MDLIFSNKTLKNELNFYREAEAFSGVNKIADKVRKDIERVFDICPDVCSDRGKVSRSLIIYGTIGKSPVIEELKSNGIIDLSSIEGKREVYLFQVVDKPFNGVEKALIIAGSDKRGTIYGLFHLSEMLGVSPLVDWCDVRPVKLNKYVFEDDLLFVSKEPSVKFRGFFINDEWPAFGNWCNKNFGGFNAKAYDHVFELLLRLKGNYMWPAMWSARFEDDGPGLQNAELADEYGVVMGMSHHEPCLRQGEEYKHLRGKDSIYGDAWNFRTNEAGITKFWEDGLKRSGKFENVITVGMRGEADTAIMGRNATLADNIELLRDVLKTQRRLIKENVNEDLSKVPRMIALYKEVEEFFYGNNGTKGLMGSEELEDVILMLCDDNFGNLRTLPTEEMRKHKGGYGMYYHFDYHGWPISFEWINSSFLPKVWEQMTMAYDFGIRDLWIVNVGDICTQEFPLSYFLDLAYDFDKWGTSAINKTDEYTRQWIATQFAGKYNNENNVEQMIFDILRGYTRIAHKRRPEAMNADVYHPVNYNETKNLLAEIKSLMDKADELYKKTEKEDLPAYLSLIYYPAMGDLNIYRMQLYAGLNHYLAKLGAMEANKYIDKIKMCMAYDKELIEEYHTIADGKWYGMGMSEHIGFTHWNEDECQNPVLMQVLPADKQRIILSVDGTEQHAEGSGWLNTRLSVDAFLEPDVTETTITLYSVTDIESSFEIINDIPWLKCVSCDKADEECTTIAVSDRKTESKQTEITSGTLDGNEKAKLTITIRLDRSKLGEASVPAGSSDSEAEGNPDFDIISGEIYIKLPSGKMTLMIPVIRFNKIPDHKGSDGKIFINTKGYISMEAEHYFLKMDYSAAFKTVEDYGKTLSGMKAFPTTSYFSPCENAPYLEYHFYMQEAGEYEAELYMQPSNAVTTENRLLYGISINDDSTEIISTIPKGEKVGDQNYFWADGVLNNIRRKSSIINCVKGLNKLRIYAVTPGFVLEKVVIYPKGCKPAESFLGPNETYNI